MYETVELCFYEYDPGCGQSAIFSSDNVKISKPRNSIGVERNATRSVARDKATFHWKIS